MAAINATEAASVLLATGGSTPLTHLPTPALLAPLLQLTTLLLSSPAHPTLFPYPWMFVLHAVRCSTAWRGIIKANTLRARASGQEPKGLTWAADVFGFLVMSWGGGLLAHFITGKIPPPLLHPASLFTYVPIHIAISFFLSVQALDFLHPSGPFLDVIMPYIDGATRAGAVALGVNLASAHSPDSLLLQIGLGTLTACGGGQTCSTLGLWYPDGWKLSTPGALAARTPLEGIDVWAPFLATIAYIVLGGTHEDVLPLTRPAVAFFGRVGLVPALGKDGALDTSTLAVLSPTAARAAATLIITSAFVWRASYLHGRWAVASLTAFTGTSASSTAGKGSGKKGRKSIAAASEEKGASATASAVDASAASPVVRRSQRRKT